MHDEEGEGSNNENSSGGARVFCSPHPDFRPYPIPKKKKISYRKIVSVVHRKRPL
jgi:hypothetical protein